MESPTKELHKLRAKSMSNPNKLPLNTGSKHVSYLRKN
jgi:hypothetical protein